MDLACVPAREAWCGSLASDRAPRVLSEAEMSNLAGYPFHRGILAQARRPPGLSLAGILASPPISEAPVSTVLAVPELTDPENLGSSFRNAAALGCSALLLGPSGPDPLSRRVLRVSMGASLSLPWTRLGSPRDLHALEARGFAIAACVLDPEAADLRTWARPDRLALVLGNEAFGLSRPWLEACGARLTLPMRGGVDSLNVATAAALFLFSLSAGHPVHLP